MLLIFLKRWIVFAASTQEVDAVVVNKMKENTIANTMMIFSVIVVVLVFETVGNTFCGRQMFLF